MSIKKDLTVAFQAGELEGFNQQFLSPSFASVGGFNVHPSERYGSDGGWAKGTGTNYFIAIAQEEESSSTIHVLGLRVL